MKVTVVNRN